MFFPTALFLTNVIPSCIISIVVVGIALVVAGIQSLLLSHCIVYCFFRVVVLVVAIVAIVAGGVQSSSSSLSSCVICHVVIHLSLSFPSCGYHGVLLFRVAVLVLVHVVVVFIAYLIFCHVF